jgi:uncharacterized cupredoxin-like copper-binding protein
MASTITRDPPTNGTTAKASAAGPSPELERRGEGPPPIKDSRASFALFASFMAMLVALAALIGVAFKLDDQQGSAGATQAATPGASVAQPTPPAAASGALKVNMSDYTFTPPDPTAAAGKVKITAPNDGQVLHELVLAKTNADPSQLPTTADGSVDEEQLNSPGEIADVAPGSAKSTTMHLKPGNYVMFCNVPGHYAAGMYGTLTVN